MKLLLPVALLTLSARVVQGHDGPAHDPDEECKVMGERWIGYMKEEHGYARSLHSDHHHDHHHDDNHNHRMISVGTCSEDSFKVRLASGESETVRLDEFADSSACSDGSATMEGQYCYKTVCVNDAVHIAQYKMCCNAVMNSSVAQEICDVQELLSEGLGSAACSLRVAWTMFAIVIYFMPRECTLFRST